MKKLRLTILAVTTVVTIGFSQDQPQSDTVFSNTKDTDIIHRNSIGSSFFLFGNFASGDPVYFFQLNYGYRLTPKDNLLCEATTWTYYEPLGTYGASDEYYPGKIRAYGVGLGYQRFLWKNLFTSLVATPFIQQFYDTDDDKIQKGFQLYLEFILGYRFELFSKRVFLEPAYAIKYWPVNTNFPAAFEVVEDGAPKYKFEPSFNFGFTF